ncbi:hypothetical protein K1719_029923 [Acacia pycnantha]|nr:hypothetical protein K1719_029923 [Acacia pycnantha]
MKEEELSNTILSRITNMDQKLLIILDDVWEEFDLTEELGIPFGHQQKGCNLLMTTRSSHVCTKMGCQTIQLHILTNEEGLNLFKEHASLNNSYRGFKGIPEKIVKHCGGVLVAIVALARALKNQPISVWKDALKTLEDRGLDQNLEEAYNCLKLSYDNLKSQKAKELLLISSLFPEDFEIPIKLLIQIGIGLGSFNENDKYHLIRSKVHGAIMELIHSSLLLNEEEECVKMHDLVREVALWIGENDMQSLLDLEKPIKGNLRYIFWMTDKFPDKIDGIKLEYLSIYLHDSESFNVKDTFFEEMTSIKVLMILVNNRRGPTLSLTNSLQPLKSVQTLILGSLELGDISVLGNLLTLMTLCFYGCSIVELPKILFKLQKLRSLEIEGCEIERNNPFEVIEMCSQLEALTFVENQCDDEEIDAISHNGSPLTLHRYCISSRGDLSYYSENYGLSRCFRGDKLSNLVSHATFKQLVERAEVLLLEGEDGQRMWKNLVSDFVPIDMEGVMNDLIVLHLSSYPNMECLIDTKDHDPSMSAFCNLSELHLFEMAIEDLCRGPPPSGFLEQLEILKLTCCFELKSVLFNANYNLCHLESMELEDCPNLMSVFQPYTARSLIQLKKVKINNCSALEYIIVGDDGDSNQKNYYESLFPSLEELKLSRVPSFIGIVREYHQLMSSSMHKQSPPLLRHNSRNLNQSLATRASSWVQECCFLNKLRPAVKETNIPIVEDRSLDHTSPLKVDSSIDRCAHSLPTQSLLLQSLKNNFSMVNMSSTEEVRASTIGAPLFHVTQNLWRNIREIELVKCTNLISLTTLSSASIIMLEVLTIRACDQLKCIVGDEGDARTQINYNPIFAKLKRLDVSYCDALEYLFPAYAFRSPVYLESLKISNAPMLKYVFGRSQHDDSLNSENWNIQTLIDFPALKYLSIEDVPKLVSIYPENYYMRGLYLRSVILKELPEITMRPCNEFLVWWHTEQHETKVIEMCQKTLESLQVEIYNANELEHVLIKRDEMEEIVMKDVLPQLRRLTLSDLPNLIGVCHGINFQEEDYYTKVYNCPNFDTSTIQHQVDLETGNSQVEEKAEERLSSQMGEEIITQQSFTKVVEARDEGVSTSLNQAPSSILSKSSDGVDHGDIKEAGMVQNENNLNVEPISLTRREQESSYSKGQIKTKDQLTDSQPMSAMPATHFDTISQDEHSKVVEARAEGVSTSLNQAPSSILSKSSDGVDHGDIKEASMVQNENNLNVEPISLTRREQESSYSKGQIKTKDQLTDSQPMSAMPTTHFDTISQDEHSEIVEVKGEEGTLILETPHPSSLTTKEEPIPVSLNSTSLSRSPSTTGRIFEEEEKGGLITTPRHESDTKAVNSSPPGKEHKTSNQGDPFVPPMTVISSEQQASDTILPLSFVPSKALTSPKQISMSASSQSTYGGQFAEYGPSEIASSICDIKNASSVVGVKEIVNMMKLEGFDKDWLESIRIKVFNCDASEFHHKQQVLKNLGNKLEANKRELANVRNQEAKATQSVEIAQKELEATHKDLEAAYKWFEAAQSHLNVAQQEYANIRVHHSKLLEECQEILEQRDQCSEIIAAKLRPFGF